MTEISFKGKHYPKDVILQAVRWYCAYALSSRNIEEMMQERGYNIDHSTVNRWVDEYSPKLLDKFNKNKRKVGNRWYVDETYIKVKGKWKYYYRAVDKQGHTIDFLLTAKRDKKAAKRFFKKSIKSSGKPSLVNLDKSGANKAAVKQYNEDCNKRIKIRQNKYKNNIVEQDHRNIKRITRPMLGFKNFHCAQRKLKGIELMKMIKKGQFKISNKSKQTDAEIFYSLAS